MHPLRSSRGFTLLEMLVSISIIVILGALTYPALTIAIKHAQCAGCASHMRMLGIAFMTYASDNDDQIPSRVQNGDKWPVLLLPYVGDPKDYVDPGDPVANRVPTQNLASNSGNNSSFFFNGFNDLGAYTNPSITVRLANLDHATNVILLGQKINGNTQYYMDFVEAPHGNQNDILNKIAYFGGSNYTFADGSVRFMPLAQYSDQMWLANQNYVIPSL